VANHFPQLLLKFGKKSNYPGASKPDSLQAFFFFFFTYEKTAKNLHLKFQKGDGLRHKILWVEFPAMNYEKRSLDLKDLKKKKKKKVWSRRKTSRKMKKKKRL